MLNLVEHSIKAISYLILYDTFILEEPAVLPVVVHVLNLLLDVAVNALAVRSVCETTNHAQPIWSLLSGKQLLNRNYNPLSPLLVGIEAHHLLLQTDLRLDQTAIFRLPPSSL